MPAKKKSAPQSRDTRKENQQDGAPPPLEAQFRHPVYSPKGAIEGLLVEHAGATAQVVCEDPDPATAAALAALRPGQALRLAAAPAQASDKGAPAHPVYRLERLLAVDGQAPADADPGRIAGTVVRFNYAKHGAANGVVLDSGDFVHTRPAGLEGLGLKVGDRVEAEGEARPLAAGGGRVVEARSVNGRPLGGGRG
ncbi:MAG: hypothetical protein PGN26_14875 [Xylophilus ampelinus]